MLMRANLFDWNMQRTWTCDVPEQCRIIFCDGAIYERIDDGLGSFCHVDHLFFDGIDPDTICVIRRLDHEREAA